MKRKSFAIIAAYNEEKHIRAVARDTRQFVDEVVVVNDGSKDGTSKEALAAGAIVLDHVVNLGKGAAMKTGAEFALHEGAEYIIFLDADGQHEPKDVPRFIEALKKSEIVFGARKREGNMPFILRFGNWFMSEVIYHLYGLRLHDSQCGFRAIRANSYQFLVWRSMDYSVESEIIAWAGKAKLRYEELWIKTIYYDKYKGTTPLHGFPIVWNLLMWRFARRKNKKPRS